MNNTKWSFPNFTERAKTYGQIQGIKNQFATGYKNLANSPTISDVLNRTGKVSDLANSISAPDIIKGATVPNNISKTGSWFENTNWDKVLNRTGTAVGIASGVMNLGLGIYNIFGQAEQNKENLNLAKKSHDLAIKEYEDTIKERKQEKQDREKLNQEIKKANAEYGDSLPINRK